MRGQTCWERELLDAQVMVGELVAPGSVFAFLAEHRHELFPDSFIADQLDRSRAVEAALDGCWLLWRPRSRPDLPLVPGASAYFGIGMLGLDLRKAVQDLRNRQP